jgi:hypothetical protein
VRSWLGDASPSTPAAKTIGAIETLMSPSVAEGRDGEPWQVMPLPYVKGGEVHWAFVGRRPGQGEFVLDVEMSSIGRVQVRGRTGEKLALALFVEDQRAARRLNALASRLTSLVGTSGAEWKLEVGRDLFVDLSSEESPRNDWTA